MTDQKPEWLIWSNEHLAYWKPNRCGYTKFAEEAGIYTFNEAEEICNKANEFLHTDNPKILNEFMVHKSSIRWYRDMMK
jgi:hypothetical protein